MDVKQQYNITLEKNGTDGQIFLVQGLGLGLEKKGTLDEISAEGYVAPAKGHVSVTYTL